MRAAVLVLARCARHHAIFTLTSLSRVAAAAALAPSLAAATLACQRRPKVAREDDCVHAAVALGPCGVAAAPQRQRQRLHLLAVVAVAASTPLATATAPAMVGVRHRREEVEQQALGRCGMTSLLPLPQPPPPQHNHNHNHKQPHLIRLVPILQRQRQRQLKRLRLLRPGMSLAQLLHQPLRQAPLLSLATCQR